MLTRRELLEALEVGGVHDCGGCRKLIKALSYGEDLRTENERLHALLEVARSELRAPAPPTCPTCGLNLTAHPPRVAIDTGTQEVRQLYTCERCFDEEGEVRTEH